MFCMHIIFKRNNNTEVWDVPGQVTSPLRGPTESQACKNTKPQMWVVSVYRDVFLKKNKNKPQAITRCTTEPPGILLFHADACAFTSA